MRSGRPAVLSGQFDDDLGRERLAASAGRTHPERETETDVGRAGRGPQSDDIVGRERGSLHRRAVGGAESGFGIVADAPDVRAVDAGECRRYGLRLAFQIDLRRRAEGIALVEQCPDGDVVETAEGFGERERGDRGGPDEPFRAQDDRRGGRRVNEGRHFGGHFVDARRDADMRNAA